MRSITEKVSNFIHHDINVDLMRKIVLMFLCGMIVGQQYGNAQGRKCGVEDITRIMMSRDPSYVVKEQHRKEHIKAQTRAYAESKANAKFKTTATVYVPVVIHVVLNTAQITELGGINGIRQRAISQIQAINKDFSYQNPDQIAIPGAFKTLAANSEIQFGLAHRKPDGSGTEGFEVITTTQASYSINDLATGAKYDSLGGADSWDPTRYLNVWVVNLGSGGILGFTLVPGAQTPVLEAGVVLTHMAFGVRAATADKYFQGIDKGRTATHEFGHFFLLDHIWGDDNGLCPTDIGGQDDGIADTPPQSDYTYNSHHPNGVIPYPLTDICNPLPSGRMWMNFMDYVNDDWMYMFTAGQASRMQASVAPGGINHSLTLHPELLQWPTDVADIDKVTGMNIFPNPSTGNFNVSFVDPRGLQSIQIINVVGQNVHSVRTNNAPINNYNIDLTGFSKGIYMVQCTFDRGTVTRKIVLQ